MDVRGASSGPPSAGVMRLIGVERQELPDGEVRYTGRVEVAPEESEAARGLIERRLGAALEAFARHQAEDFVR